MRRDRGDDRFDREIERKADRRAEQEPQRTPVITSTRGPRYVGIATCPLCFCARVGVTFHGVLTSGQGVYQLATHSPGAPSRQHGKPRCNGSEKRLANLPDGTWRPL